jgi:hypothetical protein
MIQTINSKSKTLKICDNTKEIENSFNLNLWTNCAQDMTNQQWHMQEFDWMYCPPPQGINGFY